MDIPSWTSRERERGKKVMCEELTELEIPRTKHRMHLLKETDLDRLKDNLRLDVVQLKMEDMIANLEDEECRKSRWKKERRASLAVKTFAYSPQRESWMRLHGILDSGATRTTGSVENHLPPGIRMQPLNYNGKLPRIMDAGGHLLDIVGTAVIDFRLEITGLNGHIAVDQVEVQFVRGKNWKTLLLGGEVVANIQALPWQTLGNRLIKGGRANYDTENTRVRADYRSYCRYIKGRQITKRKVVKHEETEYTKNYGEVEESIAEVTAIKKRNKYLRSENYRA
ncbi:MAG: hypothetical protein MI921_03985, partial [Cytophagales bacterium]|nr:hypothetical protein [Cytophagales bacterium]